MTDKGQQPLSILACSLGLALGAPALFGQSFSELEARLKEHPALEAVRLESEAYHAAALAATAWPDPVVSAGINHLPLSDLSFRTFMPTNKALSASQQIPSRSVRAARSAQAQRSASRNEALEDMRFARMRSDLLIALLDRRRIAEEQALLRRQDALCAELGQIAEGEIAAGRPALFRLAGIDLQRAEIARSLAGLQAEEADAEARLADLVGGAGAVVLPLFAPISWPGSPDTFHAVRVAEAEIAVAEAGVEKARAAWKPDWELSVSWQQRDSGGTEARFPGDDWVSAAVAFSVPLWASRSQAPALRAARAQRESAVSRRAAAARGAAARYSALNAKRRAAEAAIEALNAKITAVREQVAAQRTKYESGTGDYSPIIDGKLAELILRVRIAREQARRDSAVARLNSMLAAS